MGLPLLFPIDPINVHTKFEVRSFTRSWDNRGHSKIGVVPGYAHAPFSTKVLMGFCSDGPAMFRQNLKSIALPVLELIPIEVLGGGCEPPILVKRRP